MTQKRNSILEGIVAYWSVFLAIFFVINSIFLQLLYYHKYDIDILNFVSILDLTYETFYIFFTGSFVFFISVSWFPLAYYMRDNSIGNRILSFLLINSFYVVYIMLNFYLESDLRAFVRSQIILLLAFFIMLLKRRNISKVYFAIVFLLFIYNNYYLNFTKKRIYGGSVFLKNNKLIRLNFNNYIIFNNSDIVIIYHSKGDFIDIVSRDEIEKISIKRSKLFLNDDPGMPRQGPR